MRLALHIASFELTRLIRDRGAFFWLLLFPVIYAGFFGMVQFSGDAGATIGICVADADSGFLAQGIRSSLVRYAEEFQHGIGSEEYARSDTVVLQEIVPADSIPRHCARLVRIPPGFTDSLKSGGTATITMAEGSSGDPMASLTVQTMMWRAIVDNLVALVTAFEDSTGGDVESAFLVSSKEEPRIEVTSSYAGGVHPPPQGLQQTVPGTIVMMVLMVLVTHGCASLVVERKRGLLMHLAATPASRRQIIWGKLIGRYYIGIFQIALLWILSLISHHLLGIWIGYRLFEVLPLLAIYAFSAAGIALFISALARNVDTGIGVGIAVTLVMSALGGCWWPLEVVPQTMRLVGHLFPTAWVMDALHQLMAYDHGMGHVVPHLIILAAYGVVFSLAASKVLRIA